MRQLVKNVCRFKPSKNIKSSYSVDKNASKVPKIELPEEYTKGYNISIATSEQKAMGLEREEFLDPHYFDELLPCVIDVEAGIGSSYLNPILVPSFGEKERVVGCLGNCWEGPNIDYDNSEHEFWVMDEDSMGVCADCGLHFWCVSNETLAELDVDTQGSDLHTQPTQKKYLKEAMEILNNVPKEEYEPITQEQYEIAKSFLDAGKGVFADSDLEAAKQHLEKIKAEGLFDHIELGKMAIEEHQAQLDHTFQLEAEMKKNM